MVTSYFRQKLDCRFAFNRPLYLVRHCLPVLFTPSSSLFKFSEIIDHRLVPYCPTSRMIASSSFLVHARLSYAVPCPAGASPLPEESLAEPASVMYVPFN